MALVLCKNSSGIWGWRDENSTAGYSKLVMSSDNRILVESSPSLDINYTGKPIQQKLFPGRYKIECWGASGGIGTENVNPYGYGGYTSGEIELFDEKLIWLYIGRRGSHYNESTFMEASFNGGGYYVADFNNGHNGGGGGGASDIRLIGGSWDDLASLRSRIMVAPGGGGAQSNCGGNSTSAGHGGGLVGAQSYNSTEFAGYRGSYANGGTQISGGTSNSNEDGSWTWEHIGSFGKGANALSCGAGGGGGYYGGGSTFTAGGGGGSAFISGLTGCNAIDINGTHTGQPNHYSGLIFKNSLTKAAINNGDGSIKITLLEPYLVGKYLVKDGDSIGWRVIKKV